MVCCRAPSSQAGPPGRTSAGPDRIEHAGIVPPGYADQLARLGLAVVTQPGFIAARGDWYEREVAPGEQAWLYPVASLLRAGVTVAAGTDAPFGPANPWDCVAAAVTRQTPGGHVLGPAERVTARTALAMFLAAPETCGTPRTVSPGQPADLCLLHGPLDRSAGRAVSRQRPGGHNGRPARPGQLVTATPEIGAVAHAVHQGGTPRPALWVTFDRPEKLNVLHPRS